MWRVVREMQMLRLEAVSLRTTRREKREVTTASDFEVWMIVPGAHGPLQ